MQIIRSSTDSEAGTPLAPIRAIRSGTEFSPSNSGKRDPGRGEARDCDAFQGKELLRAGIRSAAADAVPVRAHGHGAGQHKETTASLRTTFSTQFQSPLCEVFFKTELADDVERVSHNLPYAKP